MLVENRFEDLIFWQRARELSRLIMSATGELPLKRHYELSVQLERAAMAIMGDIAEGWACDQKQDYVNFLHSAISAACSLQSYLYLALDLRCVNQKQFGDLYNRASEIVHMVDAYAAQLQEGKRPSPRRHRPS
ncbi:MAG: four helix bundle protein [Acidobacteriota bacterium]